MLDEFGGEPESWEELVDALEGNLGDEVQAVAVRYCEESGLTDQWQVEEQATEAAEVEEATARLERYLEDQLAQLEGEVGHSLTGEQEEQVLGLLLADAEPDAIDEALHAFTEDVRARWDQDDDRVEMAASLAREMNAERQDPEWARDLQEAGEAGGEKDRIARGVAVAKALREPEEFAEIAERFGVGDGGEEHGGGGYDVADPYDLGDALVYENGTVDD